MGLGSSAFFGLIVGVLLGLMILMLGFPLKGIVEFGLTVDGVDVLLLFSSVAWGADVGESGDPMSLGIVMIVPVGSSVGIVLGTLITGPLVDAEIGILLSIAPIVLGLSLLASTGFCQIPGAFVGLGFGVRRFCDCGLDDKVTSFCTVDGAAENAPAGFNCGAL
jgi:hypothetical protein